MEIIKARFEADDDGDQYANGNTRCQSGNIKYAVVFISE
jgi:hypothetical protein